MEITSLLSELFSGLHSGLPVCTLTLTKLYHGDMEFSRTAWIGSGESVVNWNMTTKRKENES